MITTLTLRRVCLPITAPQIYKNRFFRETGGFYLDTPDLMYSDLDLDLVSSEEFIDELGILPTSYFSHFEKAIKLDEVGHGDWVVEAICQTLDDQAKPKFYVST